MIARTIFALSLFASLAQASSSEIPYQDWEINRCEAVKKRAVSDEHNRVYNKAFPQYIEFCAGSTWQKRGATDGGNFGHAFGLIHGACLKRDQDGNLVSPQQFVECDGGTVGFSSESIMFNQQWIGGESRDFILYGNHDPSQPFDKAAYEKVRTEAFTRGMFYGFEARPSIENEYKKKALQLNIDLADYRRQELGDYTFGTEFAMAATRGGVACTRIPLTSTKPGSAPLKTVLTYLNKLNQTAYNNSKVTPPGRTEPIGYDYDGIVNNCAHTVYNALASLGMWPWKDNTGHPQWMPIVAWRGSRDSIIPFTQLLDAYRYGKEMKQAQIERMIVWFHEDHAAFKRFKETGWYGTQVGTMLDEVPALTYKNEVFDPSNKTNFVSIFGLAKDQFAKLLSLANAQWFNEKTPVRLAPYQPDKDEFDGYLNDKKGPAISLIANLKFWQREYQDTLSYLETLNPDRQDEIVAEITSYIRSKLNKTNDLLKHEQELTANLDTPTCTND